MCFFPNAAHLFYYGSLVWHLSQHSYCNWWEMMDISFIIYVQFVFITCMKADQVWIFMIVSQFGFHHFDKTRWTEVITMAVSIAGFCSMDENWWNYIESLLRCELFTPLGCKPVISVLAINLLCCCLCTCACSLFSHNWVYIAQNRLTGWKHRTDIFRRKCISAHFLVLCLTATEVTCSVA